jgi:hypothetical protein
VKILEKVKGIPATVAGLPAVKSARENPSGVLALLVFLAIFILVILR